MDDQVTIEIRFTAFGHSRCHSITAPLQDNLSQAVADWVRKQQTSAKGMRVYGKARAAEIITER